MVMEQLIMIGRSEGMFCKRENIGLVLKRSIRVLAEGKRKESEIFWNSKYFEARMKR